jgi:PAS domain S-box-containing protein
MSNPPSSETSQHPVRSADAPESVASRPEKQAWFLRRLDSLLSEPLRTAAPSDVVRHRILVGATCFLLLFSVLYVVAAVLEKRSLVLSLIALLANLGTLVLARRSRTLTAPAMLQMTNMSFGVAAAIFSGMDPYGSSQAAAMLLPALAVYLLGPRLGLLITLVFMGVLCVGYPTYLTFTGIPPAEPPLLQRLWGAYIATGFSFLGAWGLGALHSTARRAAQASLERTLKVLRESETQLNSVLESTDDVVLSLDVQGRVITANSAAKRMIQLRTGESIVPGQQALGPGGEARTEGWTQRFAQVFQGERLRLEEEYRIGDARFVYDVRVSPMFDAEGRVLGLTLFGRDITARKEAEARLGEMHHTLVDVSRQAGMAEIATGVLHNVGNTLNSVNISTALVTDRLRQSHLSRLAKATNLLREHSADFASFFTRDPQGQKLPGYLIALSDQLQEEREAVLQEMRSLSESVDHIKSIVSMQQKHARAAGAVEELAVPQLIDEALRLHAVSFERLGIRIECDYADVPPILVDRHKLLQILINLLSNARHALVASSIQDKRLRIRVRRAPEGSRLLIEVADNGEGIAPENLPRMFTQGFTTKKDGHGFGLHISALAAAEMKGQLSCGSPGPGQGATFTLELPLEGGA